MNHRAFCLWQVAAVLVVFLGLSSCEQFLETDITPSRISSELVFSDDVTATAALTGIYAKMFENSFANGNNRSVVALAGLSVDELLNHNQDPSALQFEQNSLDPNNLYVEGLWTSLYSSIYQTNAILEGLSGSQGIAPETKTQLQGEALFIRAFCYFYLTNLFGDVPLVTTTHYSTNATLPRQPKNEVTALIIEDLIQAQNLLRQEYVSPERVRPNKFAATALLSRVYLYSQDWYNAEAQASRILDNTTLYHLENDLNRVFLNDSKEAVWQLRSVLDGYMTMEGYYFIIDPTIFSPRSNILSTQFIGVFEEGDKRRLNWVGEWSENGTVTYFPYKYKVVYNFLNSAVTEHSMVFRLAEQYLIRAEARAQQDDLSGSIADLDVIRSRAGLPLIHNTNPGISRDDLLLAIEQERRVEFFAEWGHRWFDLRRTGRVGIVLSVIKPEWNPNDQLYPIPQSEFNKNPKLGLQNPGY